MRGWGVAETYLFEDRSVRLLVELTPEQKAMIGWQSTIVPTVRIYWKESPGGLMFGYTGTVAGIYFVFNRDGRWAAERLAVGSRVGVAPRKGFAKIETMKQRCQRDLDKIAAEFLM